MSDIYDDDNLNIVQDSEIGEPGPGVFAPDAHRLAGLDATHHHDADYGAPDTVVTVVNGTQCVHDGVVYGSGETLEVPRAVANFMVRSGWATSKSDTHAELIAPVKVAPTRASGGRIEPRKVPSKRTR